MLEGVLAAHFNLEKHQPGLSSIRGIVNIVEMTIFRSLLNEGGRSFLLE